MSPTALPTWLESNGYRSALLGKYLNEYPYPGGYDGTVAEKAALKRFVPPGWQSWFSPVDGTPYRQRDTILNVNGDVDAAPRIEFLDQLMGDRLLDLVNGLDGMNLRDGGKFVYYASYSPHSPYAAPERYDAEFRDVRYPRTPSFDEDDVSDKYGLSGVRSRHDRRQGRPDRRDASGSGSGPCRSSTRTSEPWSAGWRRRAPSTTPTSCSPRTTATTWASTGSTSPSTTSSRRPSACPLLVRGPGIEPGTRISELAGNIDLAPTIADMTDTPAPDRVDGLSLLPLLERRRDGRCPASTCS